MIDIQENRSVIQYFDAMPFRMRLFLLQGRNVITYFLFHMRHMSLIVKGLQCFPLIHKCLKESASPLATSSANMILLHRLELFFSSPFDVPLVICCANYRKSDRTRTVFLFF